MKPIRALLDAAVGPFSKGEHDGERPTYILSHRFRNVLFRGRAHLAALRKTPHRWAFAKNFVFITYGPWLPRSVPTILYIELTNLCNLRCVYCQSPLGLRPRGMMSDETFSALLRSLDATPIPRLHVVGNGEPTLHPKFELIVTELRRRAHILDVVTNGHWKTPGILDSLLMVDRVDVSVDGADRDSYARSRRGGDFDVVRRNLEELARRKRESRSKTLIYVRVMLRPSEMDRKAELLAAWRGLGDVVSPCPVIQAEPLPPLEDVFAVGNPGRMPKCRRPFSTMVVAWDGEVPLCGPALFKPPHPHNRLGSLDTGSLAEMFDAPLMRQYRRAHRRRLGEDMPRCRGCTMAF